jgi:hypothetical protein
VRFQQRVKLRAEQHHDMRVLDRARLRRAEALVEQRDFAEKRAGPQLQEQFLRRRRQDDLDAPAQHQEKSLTFLTRIEDHFVGEILAFVHEAAHHREIARGEVLEEHNILQQLQARIARGHETKEHWAEPRWKLSPCREAHPRAGARRNESGHR